ICGWAISSPAASCSIRRSPASRSSASPSPPCGAGAISSAGCTACAIAAAAIACGSSGIPEKDYSLGIHQIAERPFVGDGDDAVIQPHDALALPERELAVDALPRRADHVGERALGQRRRDLDAAIGLLPLGLGEADEALGEPGGKIEERKVLHLLRGAPQA